MKPSTNRRDSGSRRLEGRSLADMQPVRGDPAQRRPEEIPPYLLNPEGLEAPLPEVTELPPVRPKAHQPQGGHLLETLRGGASGHRGPAQRGLDPYGSKQRHAPIVPLREHRVHGRGQ